LENGELAYGEVSDGGNSSVMVKDEGSLKNAILIERIMNRLLSLQLHAKMQHNQANSVTQSE